MNWANDCVEFYIDPGDDGGFGPMSNSTSDIQLVVDANNQKNVYMTTSAYKAQVLAGVTSAVSLDASGWWLEVRIAKNALDPDLPTENDIAGVDFAFRDNDSNNDPAVSTMYTWSDDLSGTDFPSKIPDGWGDAALAGLSLDSTPPGPVAGFAAAGGDEYVALSWTNPGDADFAGTLIRYKISGYPTGPADGTLLVDKSNSPGSNDSHTHSNLTNGERYYYAAFAHDGVLNYASAVSASAIPSTSSGADFDSDGDVDQEDFGHLQACLAGAGALPVPVCEDADLDGDLDVDEDDCSVFLECLAGANRPPGC
jgi:hypothetical protein